ncbi:MAG: hypothetical protein Q8L68_03585, partial [Methylococcales bacterium]|nr:hypothetical protein [Methylococcales bacterium]
GMRVGLGALLLSGAAIAHDFPKGCEPRDFQFSNYNLVLNEQGDQRLFLIQNRSTEAVDLSRLQGRNDFMNPSLSAKLAPGTWAAFASDIANLNFECHITEGENTRKIDCAQALDVCEYPRAKFALSNMGNYWISANKPRQNIVQDAATKGIYLHW